MIRTHSSAMLNRNNKFNMSEAVDIKGKKAMDLIQF